MSRVIEAAPSPAETDHVTSSADRARDARQRLTAARSLLAELGYEQIRFDQYEHPVSRTLVETGYTYGETRLVVHVQIEDHISPAVTDLRLCGTSDPDGVDDKYKLFEHLIRD